VWIGATALAAAMFALPLAPSSWHGPEVASVLAVAATALLAGERWAVAVIVIAELFLIPTAWPRTFLGDGDVVVRVSSLLSMIAMVPGVLALRRAAAALVIVSGRRRTRRACRQYHALLVATGIAGIVLPLVF
jgi:hypothetical protein